MSGDSDEEDAGPRVDGADDGDGDEWRERGYRAVERLVNASMGERAVISVAALLLAIVVGGVIVFVSGYFATCTSATAPPVTFSVPGVGPLFTVAGGVFCYNPFTVYYHLFVGAVETPLSLALTLQATAILVLAGLSVAVSFRAGLFNIGTQGQMVLGALATGVTATWLVDLVSPGVPGAVVVISGSVLAAVVVGGIWGAIPGVLKAYADANEVITTIMLNIIASGLAFTFVNEILNPGGNTQTEPIPSWARLGPVIGYFDVTSSYSTLVLVAVVALAVGVYVLLNYSTFGYNVRVSGLQPDAAEYSGVSAKRVIVSTMTLAGVFGGLAGAAFVLMAQGYWADGLPGYGFDGITVSVLASNSPVGVLPASFLFGILRAGTLNFQFAPSVQVPPSLSEVLRGVIVLLVAMPELFRMLGKRAGIGEDPGEKPASGVSADD